MALFFIIFRVFPYILYSQTCLKQAVKGQNEMTFGCRRLLGVGQLTIKMKICDKILTFYNRWWLNRDDCATGLTVHAFYCFIIYTH